MSSYGFSFGIELTADNVLAAYFNDHFGLTTSHAGDVAAVFGLINFVSRPLGRLLLSIAETPCIGANTHPCASFSFILCYLLIHLLDKSLVLLLTFLSDVKATALEERIWLDAGGILSDMIGRTVGMRGRLWWLFFLQMGGAIMCIILGIGPVQSKLSHTIGVIIVFSFFIEVS